ncbi:protein-export chaperone SecB [Domibacillus sp. PGB-M46]|uniref:protein-export chaperone SecB n=1 Tax=Domibacillus sp. PGB-M46 TaxID=2910255 RepID=UPI001F58DBDA|nr:protein-export chaperone SecB [Domibacillus sp. PGB-M46]MCI2253427.1 protein-export chaperone SecB [Domibacillus sp. PGB-M46]
MGEPIFNFTGYTINKLEYSKEPIEGFEQKENDSDFGFTIEQGITEDLKEAKLTMSVQLESKEKDAFLFLEIDGFFDLNESMRINEKNEKRDVSEIQQLLVVNGIGIVYPYLRTIVSMISSLDSHQSIILPTLDLRSIGTKN